MIGEFNNVLKTHDMVGGIMVHEGEYVDMASMMDKTWLFEIYSVGVYTHYLIRMLRAQSTQELTEFLLMFNYSNCTWAQPLTSWN